MTAYTSSDVDFSYVNQEGNSQQWILHLDRLNKSDTLDITPYVPTGMKAVFIRASDHGTTVVSGTTTVTLSNEYECSYVVSTDIITFGAAGGGANSTDAHVEFKVVPSR